MSRRCGLFVLISIVSISAHQSQIMSENECRTPNNERGLCIDIRRCESLVKLLISSKENATYVSFLRNSRCGEVPNVCCPTNETDSELSKLPSFRECGQQAEDRIIGGIQTPIDYFAWIVQLWYTNTTSQKYSSECSGVLINKDHIVTAAHCVNSEILNVKNLKLEKIRLGEWDTSTDPDCNHFDCADPSIDVSIAAIYQHENYDPKGYCPILYCPKAITKLNDIAVVRLTEQVKYSDFIRPICLPTTDAVKKINYDNKFMTASGWGFSSPGVKSAIKLRGRVIGISNENCSSSYESEISELQLCTLSGGGADSWIDSCRGDSGSPLISASTDDSFLPFYYLAGVATFDLNECNTSKHPNIYTRVDQYTDWIISKL